MESVTNSFWGPVESVNWFHMSAFLLLSLRYLLLKYWSTSLLFDLQSTGQLSIQSCPPTLLLSLRAHLFWSTFSQLVGLLHCSLLRTNWLCSTIGIFLDCHSRPQTSESYASKRKIDNRTGKRRKYSHLYGG